MEYRELVADPGKPKENITRWIYRPPDTPPQVPAHKSAAYPRPLSDGQLLLHDPSTSLGLQHETQPTTMIPFQFNQHAAYLLESIHTQETHLSQDVQRQLAELEWQHEVARYQVLEKAQVVPASPHVQDTADSYPYTAMDWTASGYTGADDYTIMPVNPSQVPNQGLISTDSRTAHGFDANLWPSQQLPPPIDYPNASQNHVQDVIQQNNTILGVQDVDYNAFSHSAYSQQPVIHPVTFETSHHRMMSSVLSPHDQGNHYEFPMAPPRSPCIQLSVPLYDVRSSPVVLGEFPTCQTNRPLHGLTAPHEGAGWDSHIPLAPGQSLNMIITAINYLDSINLDASGIIGPQHPVTNMKRLDRGGKRKLSIFDSAPEIITKSGREMDEIEIYEGPDADHQRQKQYPKVYSKRVKMNPRACFGCRRQNRRCEIASNGICLRCQNILRTYSHRTVLPRFTCNVRTKFSEMPLYTNIGPSFSSCRDGKARPLFSPSRPLKIAWDDGFPPIRIEDDKTCAKCIQGLVSRLMLRLRGFLDVLEPLRIRQISFLEDPRLSFWSYSFSMVRWARAICFFWPDLKVALQLHEQFHLWSHRIFLRLLDKQVSASHPSTAAMWLNSYYEGITDLKDNLRVDIAAKEHVLSSVTHHLLHLYRSMLPKSPERYGTERQDELNTIATYFRCFPQTANLLPKDCRYVSMGGIASTMMRMQKVDPTYQDTMTERTNHTCPLGTSGPAKRPPALNAYCSAKFIDTFKPEAILLAYLEEVTQRAILRMPVSLRDDFLDFSPWALSIGLRAFLGHPDQQRFLWTHPAIVFGCIVTNSAIVFEEMRKVEWPTDHSLRGLFLDQQELLDTQYIGFLLTNGRTAQEFQSQDTMELLSKVSKS